jgi:hypothetical protein
MYEDMYFWIFSLNSFKINVYLYKYSYLFIYICIYVYTYILKHIDDEKDGVSIEDIQRALLRAVETLGGGVEMADRR